MNDEKLENKQFKLSEIIVILLITIIIGFILGLSVFKAIAEDKETTKNNEDTALSKFIDNYNYIIDNYYGELDKDELIENAISGMIESIDDPYTTYLDETTSNSFSTSLEGSFEGIGVEVINDSDDNIIIYRVLEDSPASKAGLQSMDIIKSINGESLENTKTTDFVKMVKKSTSKTFNIKIERDGKEIDVTLNREHVTIKSVTSEIFEKNNKKIGYIYISIFASNTYQQFKEELEKLETSNIDSLIIDVRSNTGGYLISAENIISLFLDSKHVIYQTEDKKGTEKYYSKGTITKEYPIAILTNEASASASEILTAALKEEYGAISIGKKTYGKGTVQELKTLPDGEQYKFTTKKWLTPNGTWINEIGINVDVEVEFNKDYYENPTYENDIQLQTAINEISNK